MNEDIPSNGPELAIAFSKVLSNFASINSTGPVPTLQNPFRIWCEVPPISIHDFCLRLEKYFKCSSSCFIVATCYVGKLQSLHPDLFHPLTIHKIALGVLVVATKFCDDIVCSQTHYARCGGIECMEMNVVESTVFHLLSFNASVADSDYRISSLLLANVDRILSSGESDSTPGAKRRSRQSQ